MSTQMAALDDFVTRARSQNDNAHVERGQSLNKLVANVSEGFASLERGSTEQKTILDNFEGEIQSHSNGEGLVASFRDTLKPHLQDLKAEVTRSTFKEYLPTGQTPQKRDWEYPTTLPRTDNHESIMARLYGLPDPALASKTPPSRTPARSPRKHTSPRKGFGSPNKTTSPSKTKVFNDVDSFDTLQHQSNPQNQVATTAGPVDQGKAGMGLKEIDINVLGRPPSGLSAPSLAAGAVEEKEREREGGRPVLLDFSKSLGHGTGQPPLKRHATTNAVVESKLPAKQKFARAKSTMTGMGMNTGVENFSQSIGPSMRGRRLRSMVSPPE